MLKNYVLQKGLIESILTLEEILSPSLRESKVNIMMGQTFDSGQPLDMMKYALFIMNLHDIISLEGGEVVSNWLIADHFMTQINRDKDMKEAESQVTSRINYLERLNEIYGGKIGFILSSRLSSSGEYKEILRKLKKEMKGNLQFREKVMQTVPEDRRDDLGALDYPLEELATIQTMETKIKVGPKYEIFYDSLARDFSQIVGLDKYIAISLTNVFPVGSPEISKKLIDEIEVFGVLPYKKNSKGLGDYRIDPINDDFDRARVLVESTNNTKSLLNLLVIVDMARQRIDGKLEPSYFAQMSDLGRVGDIKDLVVGLYEKYVYELLNS